MAYSCDLVQINLINILFQPEILLKMEENCNINLNIELYK